MLGKEVQESPVLEKIQNEIKDKASNSQSFVNKSSSEKLISSQLDLLDPKKVHWNNDEEIYVHMSGMCFGPIEKVYFSYLNPDEYDIRPLYYRQSNGDLNLAVRGKLGLSNKIVLKDCQWDRKAIYTPQSRGYKPNLLALFKERVKA